MIEINHLTFGYKKKYPLFDDLNLQLPTGKIYGLLGKNGAGKSTLLKQIAGLLYPQQGECLVNGLPSRQRLPQVLSDMYFIPEEFQLPAVSISTFVKLHAPFYPNFDATMLQKHMDEFEIGMSGKIASLSFGQRKKFIIAFGLATNTRLLILDEPTNGLDIPSKSQFRRIIASSMNEERNIIISTHQVRDLSSLIDHIVVLEKGKIIFDHSTVDISSKLAFLQTKDTDHLKVIYSEKVLAGNAVVCLNDGEETEIDLELLFNGVIAGPASFKNVFKN
jgi:ABC-2 type transport system ATP-binding protein